MRFECSILGMPVQNVEYAVEMVLVLLFVEILVMEMRLVLLPVGILVMWFVVVSSFVVEMVDCGYY